MSKINLVFASLFKKFRLRSQIDTLSEFGDLLASEGYVYENSIFSRWQKGERIPKERQLLIKIIKVFIKRGGITFLSQANDLLAAVELRDLDKKESKELELLIIQGGVSVNELVEYQNLEIYSSLEGTLKKDIDKNIVYSNSYLDNFANTIFFLINSLHVKKNIVFKLNNNISLLLGSFFILTLWWLFIFIYKTEVGPFNLGFSFAYGLLPLIGGFTCIFSIPKTSLVKSSIVKSIFFLSCGLITWGLGELVWSFYNLILHIEIPYPSLADVLFVLSWPLWGTGLYFLSRATGIKYVLESTWGKIVLLTIPLISTIISYYLLILVARNGQLINNSDFTKIIFDLIYPFFDVLIVIEALLIFGLSLKYIQEKYKYPLIMILLGIIFNYFADFAFSYTTTKGVFFNGSFVDMLFLVAMFFISIGVNSLSVDENL